MNLPKRELLSFLTVLALPHASSTGFVCSRNECIFATLIFWPCISTYCKPCRNLYCCTCHTPTYYVSASSPNLTTPQYCIFPMVHYAPCLNVYQLLFVPLLNLIMPQICHDSTCTIPNLQYSISCDVSCLNYAMPQPVPCLNLLLSATCTMPQRTRPMNILLHASTCIMPQLEPCSTLPKA